MSAEVKICGVTRVEDAVLAVDLGASYLGLNFWTGSPRFLTLERAREIVAAVSGRVPLVGVWVAPERQRVEALAAELSLDLLQFHGVEDDRAAAWFPGRVIQAIRPGSGFGSRDLSRYPDAWGFLFDRAPEGEYGGTGRTWSYERIADLETDKRVILAGGLSPETVGDAIRRSGVEMVDVCSGVETAPGQKDPDLMSRFFSEVRNAQESG